MINNISLYAALLPHSLFARGAPRGTTSPMLATWLSCLGSSERETAERRRPVAHEDVPFAHNAERWLTLPNGNEAAVCDACFPQSATAAHLCLPECIFPASDILEVHEHVVDGKVAPEGQPWFIIGYGPPASGKGGIVAALERLSAFGVTPRNTVAAEVDGLFQNRLSVGRRFSAQQERLSAAARTDQEREQAAGRLYTAYRFVADQISDAVLWKAAARRMNVYYETTGACRRRLLDRPPPAAPAPPPPLCHPCAANLPPTPTPAPTPTRYPLPATRTLTPHQAGASCGPTT